MKNRYSDKNNFIDIIKSSGSIRECLQKLGIDNYKSAGHYKTFHRYCRLYNVEAPKVDTSKSVEYARNFITQSLDDILVENSTYSNPTRLKKRLLREGLLVNSCGKCGGLPEWNGDKLVLQLDHINGINTDNRIGNLRLLCPNCHSQTDTFSGRKKKPKRPNYTPRLSSRKAERPPYEDLIRELENSNFVQVGKKYGVSDNAVRKWIKYYRKEVGTL